MSEIKENEENKITPSEAEIEARKLAEEFINNVLDPQISEAQLSKIFAEKLTPLLLAKSENEKLKEKAEAFDLLEQSGLQLKRKSDACSTDTNAYWYVYLATKRELYVQRIGGGQQIAVETGIGVDVSLLVAVQKAKEHLSQLESKPLERYHVDHDKQSLEADNGK